MANEEISVKQSRDNSELDDIHVPGLGVRGALADDGPENPRIWSRARDTYSKQRALAGHWTSRVLKDVRLAGARLVVKRMKIADECKGALRGCHRLAIDMANLADHRLRRMHVLVGSGAYLAALRLRSAVAVQERRARSFTTILREERAQILRATHGAWVQIDRACKESWPRILEATDRCSRRAQLFLVNTVARVTARVRAPVGQEVKLRVSRDFQFDLAAWRRAIPALAALLVIAIFCFQVALVAGKR